MSVEVVASAARKRATLRMLLAEARRRLGDEREARWLLEEATGLGSSALLAALDRPSSTSTAERLRRLVARRAGGAPLQHVLGHWPFAGVELRVDGRALVPRPETELLVELALSELAAIDGAPFVIDLGTGSGAIACAVVSRHRRARVVASDLADAALSLAEENRAALDAAAASRLELRRSDWYRELGDLAGTVHLVVANPPYLAESELAALDPVVRDHDPYGALVAGPTGLEAVESVLLGAPAVLLAGGLALVEIAPSQAGAAVALARRAGAGDAAVLDDLAGRPRILRARF